MQHRPPRPHQAQPHPRRSNHLIKSRAGIHSTGRGLAINNNPSATNQLVFFYPLLSTPLLGLLSGFAFVPWQMAWLFPLALWLFMKKIFDNDFIRRQPTKVILGNGFLFYFCQNIITLSWLGSAPIVFDQSLWWVGGLITILMPALVASCYVPVFLLIKKFGASTNQKILLLWLGLSFIDGARQWFLSGFPWNIASHSFLYLSFFMPLVSVAGQYVLSCWFYGCVSLVLIFWYERNKRGIRYRPPFLIIGGLAWLLSPAMLAYYMAHRTVALENNNQNLQIVLVQPNLSVDDRYRKPLAENIATLKKTSQPATPTLNNKQPTLIIWPESAVPLDFSGNKLAAEFITNFLKPNQQLLLGTLRLNEKNQETNNMTLLNSQGKRLANYDKHHLVPYGEYLPFGKLAKSLGILPLAARNINLAAGAKPTPIKTSYGFSFLPLICYEVAFPHLINHYSGKKDKPEAIINITNDAWFGESVGPAQHLFLARLRAAENGLPLYRAAMSGISAIIDSHGQIVERIDFNNQGALVTSNLPHHAAAPFYAQHRAVIDNGLALLLLFGIFLLCLAPKLSLQYRDKQK